MLEDEQAVILAEWPDPLAQMMPQDRLEMDFVLEGGDKRRITLRAGGAVSARWRRIYADNHGNGQLRPDAFGLRL